MAQRTLIFEERVAAQKAIEQVYWSHRIWPTANPQPKPPLSAVMTDDAIRARVEDNLKKSNALEEIWQRSITSQQLQAELDRIAKSTRDPQVLQEIFVSLENDALLIAETLARQTLADRLARNWYAFDSRFHGKLRAEAERAMAKAKMADIEAKMLDLARIQAALTDLVRVCRGKGPTSVCPILDALDEQEAGHGNR